MSYFANKLGIIPKSRKSSLLPKINGWPYDYDKRVSIASFGHLNKGDHGFYSVKILFSDSNKKLYEHLLPMRYFRYLHRGLEFRSGQVLRTNQPVYDEHHIRFSDLNFRNLKIQLAADSPEWIKEQLFVNKTNEYGAQRLLRLKKGSVTYILPFSELIRFLFVKNSLTCDDAFVGASVENACDYALREGNCLTVQLRKSRRETFVTYDHAKYLAWYHSVPPFRASLCSVAEMMTLSKQQGQYPFDFQPPNLPGLTVTAEACRRGNYGIIQRILHVDGIQTPVEKVLVRQGSRVMTINL
ncbi:hypothetical protein [Endozoicomonas sp. Mp262]|uniref:hypothetical protein n=1 Tax=Endozoicomonas sp. Mp262 TaxID=2919499 RepID=UPI0021D8605E